MPQTTVLLWPWVCAHSVLVKIACRNKLCTQKENPADLLNVVIRSHSSSVIIHQCGEDDRQKLHQFKRKEKKALSLLWFPIVPKQSCLLQWYVLPLFSPLLISLLASCFQRPLWSLFCFLLLLTSIKRFKGILTLCCMLMSKRTFCN